MNTKARHLEILEIAKTTILENGGFEKISNLTNPQYKNVLRHLAKIVEQKANCHYTTAKNNIAKAMQQARGENTKSTWGGSRGGGKPRKERGA